MEHNYADTVRFWPRDAWGNILELSRGSVPTCAMSLFLGGILVKYTKRKDSQRVIVTTTSARTYN